MVPPWAKDLPNWKHYKIPNRHPARDVPQSTLLDVISAPTYDPTTPKETECPTVCIDAINECGMRYGDCLPVCEGEKPMLNVPACPVKTAGVEPAVDLL